MDASPDKKHHLQFIQGTAFVALPAPKFKRFLAYIIDIGLVSLLIYGLFFVLLFSILFFAAVNAATPIIQNTQNWVLYSYENAHIPSLILIVLLGFIFLTLMYIVLFGPFHGYFIYHEYKKQTTPGKKIFGLHVITLDGRDLTLKDVIIRDFMRHFEFMLLLPPLIAMLATEKSQRLGDLMTGTMVVYTPKNEKSHDFIYLDAAVFRQFNDTLTPKAELNAFEAQEFLKEAFPLFILRQMDLEKNQLFYSRAYSLYNEYYESKMDLDMNDPKQKQNFLRFHAQRCFDFINQL